MSKYGGIPIDESTSKYGGIPLALELTQPKDSKPEEKPADWLPMIASSLNKGIIGVPDAILNTPNRVANLGLAAYGTAATALGHPEKAPSLNDDPNFLRGLYDQYIGDVSPQTKGQQYADAGLQAASSALYSPANSAAQVLTNMGTSSVGGLSAKAAQEAGAGTSGQIAAGLIGQTLGNKAIESAQNKVAANALRKAQNAPRDQTMSEAREAGIVISPSETNPSLVNDALEGVAGKTSVRQAASLRNQEVINQLAREDIGAPDSAPLSSDLTQQIRNDAYNKGYKPVESFGVIRPGKNYRDALNAISAKYTGAANSFPAAVSNEVGDMVNSLNVRQFDSSDAVKMAQILRENASKSYANGDTALGKAQRAAANALEDQIEASITASGGKGSDLVEGFRDARKLMAKTHTIDSALNESTGNIRAAKLAAAFRTGKPLSGNLELIGKTAEAFPKDMQSPETIGAMPALSPLDVAGGAVAATTGAMAAGNPAGGLAGLYPLARPAARSLVLSDPYQKLMGTPSYRNSMIARLLAKGDLNNPAANSAILAAALSQEK